MTAHVPHVLPSLDEVNFEEHGMTAWYLLLQAEKAAEYTGPAAPKYKDKLIGVRILGFFLKDFWERRTFSLVPYRRLIKEIISCYPTENMVAGTSDAEEAAHSGKVANLGLAYRNHLMRVCEY